MKIAGWSRSENVPGEKSYRYSLYVDFGFADGESWPMKLAMFDTGTHGWQYCETVVTPPKPLRRASFHAFIREIDGTVWFDDLYFGEVNGKNLLRCPGFEKADREDTSGRQQLLADLQSLHCNTLHSYLSGTLEAWDQAPSEESTLVQFLNAYRREGIGVWLTLGLGTLPIRDTDDPNFPQYYCVNGQWGQRWSNALAKAARYPFAGLSMVPDEYNWNNGHLQRSYEKHADPKVREFYAGLGAYCDCPVCREKFMSRYGEPFPERLPSTLPSADRQYRRWLEFRYDSTTDWLRRTSSTVKKANPDIRTDPPFDIRGIADPCHASIVQKELLYLLLRTGVPTTLYYLDSVGKQELADHRTIVVPFPLAVSDAKATLLEELAQEGRRVVIFGADGPLDENGTPHSRPVLAGLIGNDTSDPGPREIKLGGGTIVYVPPTVLQRLVANRDNEKRTRLERILPSPLDADTARTVLDTITDQRAPSLPCPLMTRRLPEGDDVELCLSTNVRGDRLLLAINWGSRSRSVRLPNDRGFDQPPEEAYLLGPDGEWQSWQGSLHPELRLAGQQALVARLTNK